MVRDAVKDVQEGLGEPQEIAEAVEAEVDELPGEFDHLEGELVLLGVAKGPDVVDVTSNTHCMLTISFTITVPTVLVVLVAAVVLEAGDAEEALAAHVAGELGEAVRGVPGGHVLVEVQLKLNRCWFSF